MDILDYREQRALYQQELLNTYQLRLVVIKANYPGANKGNLYTNYVAFKGYLDLVKQLSIEFIDAQYTLEGLIIYLVVHDDLINSKKQALLIEDSKLGRLLDIDVYDQDKQISRQDLGYEPRPCFLCSNLAIVCTRNQSHSLEEIQDYFINLVMNDIFNGALYQNLAIMGMINELCKPYAFGTVSINSSGSHHDMDKLTFFNSIEAISTELNQLNKIDTTSFNELRRLGIIIEDKMFTATNGINTHKGTIFLLLLLFGAYNNVKDINLLSKEIKRLSKDIMDDFNKDSNSFTQSIYHETKITGIRGFAKSGFSFLFEEELYKDIDLLKTYLTIITQTTDTTIIKRSGLKALTIVQDLARRALEDESKVKELDDYCNKNLLSCGGSADILIVSIILNMIENYQEKIN